MIWLTNPEPENTFWSKARTPLSTQSQKLLTDYVEANKDQLKGGQTKAEDDDGAKDLLTRDSKIMWIENTETTGPLYWEIGEMINSLNNDKWNFNIDMLESLQYAEYEEGGHYAQHSDDSMLCNMGENVRKLSFSILISELDDFEGGALDLSCFAPEWDGILNQGEMISFPSMMPHIVQPVRKGKRKALVGWARGPRWV
tara:strand:+ start:1380 stop:1976 length:597 start_codon:yes stop_codon:yes gene_type:complete